MFSESTIFSAFNGVVSPVADTASIKLAEVVKMGERTPQEDEVDKNFVFSYPTLRRIIGAFRLGKNLWIWGPAGSGKTELAIQTAMRCHRPYALVSFSEETSMRDLIGTWSLKDQQTSWKDGALARAIQTPGSVVILDELNMAPSGVVAALNALLQQGELHIHETGDTLRVAEGVTFVATANTAGSVDETGMYAGSQIQNGATRSRFAGLKVGYLPAEDERQILLRKFPGLDDAFSPQGNRLLTEAMIECGKQIRSIADEGRLSLPFSVRQLLSWAEGALEFRNIADGFRFAFADLLGQGELPPVAETFHKVFGIKLED
ncbi:AAA family ATPase [Acidithiobacillus sp. MC6.1]|nr:AAA family ATPase [Acidithiobacillus sp. MC6.1]